jgi:sugar/nucleoside kinase (ribokinase family)
MTRSAEGVAVIAPSPVLTITVESGDEIHLHAGGQGFGVAWMIARLGVPVTLCCALGGETGAVLRALVEREQVGLCAVTPGSGNAPGTDSALLAAGYATVTALRPVCAVPAPAPGLPWPAG